MVSCLDWIKFAKENEPGENPYGFPWAHRPGNLRAMEVDIGVAGGLIIPVLRRCILIQRILELTNPFPFSPFFENVYCNQIQKD